MSVIIRVEDSYKISKCGGNYTTIDRESPEWKKGVAQIVLVRSVLCSVTLQPIKKHWNSRSRRRTLLRH